MRCEAIDSVRRGCDQLERSR